MPVEIIEHNKKIFAMILRKELDIENTTYFTSKDDPLQLGILRYKKGYNTKAHIHKSSRKIIDTTQEILHIIYGEIEADLYDEDENKLKSIILNYGDTIILMAGGHGFKIKEDSKIIIIKQGPYSSINLDKEFIDKNYTK